MQYIVGGSEEIIQNTLNEWDILVSLNFDIWISQQAEIWGWGSECSNEVYQATNSGSYAMVWGAVSTEEVIGPYSTEHESMTGKGYKSRLQSYAFPKL